MDEYIELLFLYDETKSISTTVFYKICKINKVE